VNENVRKASKGREKEIETAFCDLCENNRDFLTSIETTTKSIGATFARISLWSERVNHVLGVAIHVPKLIDGRII
jgi:hypothetical protein